MCLDSLTDFSSLRDSRTIVHISAGTKSSWRQNALMGDANAVFVESKCTTTVVRCNRMPHGLSANESVPTRADDRIPARRLAQGPAQSHGADQ